MCVARTRHITVKGRDETRRKKLEGKEEHFAHIPLERVSRALPGKPFQRMELSKSGKKAESLLLVFPFFFIAHSSLFSGILFLFSPITSGKLG